MGGGYSGKIIYGNYLSRLDVIRHGIVWHKESAVVIKTWNRNYQNEVSKSTLLLGENDGLKI